MSEPRLTRLSDRVQSWLRRWGAQPPSNVPLAEGRFVVVDVETTGLQVRQDSLLSIGAVVIDRLCVDFRQQFERTLRADTERALDNILIHGLTPSEIRRADDPATVLAEFVEFAGDSPLIAFAAAFDREVLRRACRRHLGAVLPNEFIDIAEIAPVLLPKRRPRENTLDAWLRVLELETGPRHNAAADALATAKLTLIVLHAALRQGIRDTAGLRHKVAVERRRLY